MTQKRRSVPAKGEPIPERWRQLAAESLAKRIDKMARILSRYGDAARGSGVDETMALSGMADLMAQWWRKHDTDECDRRLLVFIEMVRRSHAFHHDKIELVPEPPDPPLN